MDFFSSTDVNLGLINGKSISKFSSIVSLNIGALFVDVGAFSVDILTLKTQICCHHLTRALPCLSPKFLKHSK